MARFSDRVIIPWSRRQRAVSAFQGPENGVLLVVQSEFEILLEQILLIEPSPLFSFELWDLGGLFFKWFKWFN